MTVTVSFLPARNRWCVSYLLPTDTLGKYQRKRRFFASETEATSAAADVRRTFRHHGTTGLTIDPAAWKRYQFLEQRLLGLGTLEQAVEHFLRKPPHQVTPFLEELVARWLDVKEGHVTARWHRTLVRFMLRFTRALAGKRVGEVTVEDVAAFLATLDAPETKASVRRMLSQFFEWARLNQHAARNVVELVPVPRIVREEISVMPVADVRTLLRACLAERPHLIPFLALRIFGGLRTSSVERMDWSEVKLNEGIELPATKAKNRRRTFLQGFPPVLWDWLIPHAHLSGRVARSQYNAELTDLAERHGVPFPRNVLRHSFATYHLAAFRNVSETVLLLAHRGSPRVLFDHYNGRAAKSDALALFALTPAVVTTCPTQERPASLAAQ